MDISPELAELAVRDACQRLVTAFARFVDSGQGERVVQLFTPDATFERRGERLQGHAQIRAAQARRSPQVVTRHCCAPSHIELAGPGHATGVTCFQLYRHTWPDGEPVGVGPLNPPEVIGEYHDEFRRTADGWRIHARVARGIFRRAG